MSEPIESAAAESTEAFSVPLPLPLPLPLDSFLPLPDSSIPGFDSSDSSPAVNAISELRHCWINERGSPELLFYEEEIVAACQRQLQDQQRLIDKISRRTSKFPSSAGSSDQLIKQIYEFERDRINYLLNSYHRGRLVKIERDTIFIISHKENFDRLSAAEQEFARKYCDLIESHRNKAFLSGIPESLQSLVQPPSMISQPNLDRFVGFQVFETLGVAEIDDQEIDLQKGKIFFGQYKLFKELLFQEKIRLI